MLDLRAPRRSAHASIRGYLYQALLGVERWLELGSGEGPGGAADALLCEGDEDLDRVIRGEGDGRRASRRASRSRTIPARSASATGSSARPWRGSSSTGSTCGAGTTAAGSSSPPPHPGGAPREGVDLLRIWRRSRPPPGGDRRGAPLDPLPGGRRERGREGRRPGSGGSPRLAGRAGRLGRLLRGGRLEVRRSRNRCHTGQIAKLLAGRGVAAPLRETLTDRLLNQVLEASIQNEPEDRVLTAGDLDDLLELTKDASWPGRRPPRRSSSARPSTRRRPSAPS